MERIGRTSDIELTESRSGAGTPRPLVLAVCTGNICRSPVAEAVLEAALPEVDVRSAGVRALVGDAMPSEALALVTDPAAARSAIAHRARQLDLGEVRRAALILTMTREHRTTVVQGVPRAVRTAFTLREFARLVESLDPAAITALPSEPNDRVTTLVELARAVRGLVRADRPSDDDVVDPFRRSAETYEASGAQMLPALGVISRVLAS